MSIPFLLGPISTGSSFMIVSIQDGNPYLLNSYPFGGGIIYYWEKDLSIISSSNFGVFSAQGSLDSLTISDSINGGGIAFRSDGITIGNAEVPAQIKMNQNVFANWFPPDIFLSMAIYTITNISGATATILTTNSGTGTTIPANNIIILPVLWYFNCTSNGNYSNINQPLNSVINWFCLVTPNNTICSQFSIAKSGWTNLSDCNIGTNYDYCPSNQICGNDNCKGPCSVIYDDCNFQSGTFVCQFDPNKFFSETQWWTNPYFIGGIIGLFFILIIIISLIYVTFRHTNSRAQSYSQLLQ